MSGNRFDEVIVPPAPRGSKKGWVNVTGQIPGEDEPRLLSLVKRLKVNRTDVVGRAVRELLDREAA